MARLLIVDDEREAAEALKMFFDVQGLPCAIATTGDQAVELLATYQPDLILLDVQLADSRLSGFDVLREAKARRPTAKVLMVTGYQDEASHAHAQALGADGYLEKPLTPAKILEILKQAAG